MTETNREKIARDIRNIVIHSNSADSYYDVSDYVISEQIKLLEEIDKFNSVYYQNHEFTLSELSWCVSLDKYIKSKIKDLKNG